MVSVEVVEICSVVVMVLLRGFSGVTTGLVVVSSVVVVVVVISIIAS